MNVFCVRKKRMATGSKTTTDAAMNPGQLTKCCEKKLNKPSCSVYLSGLVREIRGLKKSVQALMKAKSATTVRAGRASGNWLEAARAAPATVRCRIARRERS